MAISRLDGNGRVMTANKLNILTVDNSYGDMPDACVNEPLPHFLKAEKDAPDEPAPFVWIYPMREYTTSCDADLLWEMNLGDHFICDAINDGFPLCCVASTDNFLLHDPSVYQKSTLISPAPLRREALDKLQDLARSGIGVILYATAERLAQIPDFENLTKINVEADPPSALRRGAERYGWCIRHEIKKAGIKLNGSIDTVCLNDFSANLRVAVVIKGKPLNMDVFAVMDSNSHTVSVIQRIYFCFRVK
jgi:hypothetical protein